MSETLSPSFQFLNHRDQPAFSAAELTVLDRLAANNGHLPDLKSHLLGHHSPSWPELAANLSNWQIGLSQTQVSHNGDFCDVWSASGNHRQINLAIGDAVGHDAWAALVSRLTLATLKENFKYSQSLEQITHQVNRNLLEHLEGLPEFDHLFITALYGVLDLDSGHFNFVRLGHPHPLVFDASGQPLEIEAQSSQPFNLSADLTLHLGEIIIPPGGALVCFTDGVSEAYGPPPTLPIGEPFDPLALSVPYGLEAINQHVYQSLQNGHTSQEICNTLTHSVLTHQGYLAHAPTPPQDDLTLVCLKRSFSS